MAAITAEYPDIVDATGTGASRHIHAHGTQRVPGDAMRLRHVAGYGALAAAVGVACGVRAIDVGTPDESVTEEGGVPESSAGAPAHAGSHDASALFAWSRADPSLYDHRGHIVGDLLDSGANVRDAAPR